jgi:hypothetical protein
VSFFKKLFGQKKEEPESPEFRSLIEGGMEGLRLVTAAHQAAWRFGEEESWDFSQDTGELKLTFPDKVVRTQAQILDSFDSGAGTWMWAWANSTIEENLTKTARQLRAYGQEHGVARLITPGWPADESACWEMAGFACRLCDGQGAYRGPVGTTFVFFTFGEVQLSKNDDDSAYRPR